MTKDKPVRRERQARRTELVAAARQLLLEHPVEAVGMADVATAGDMSRPSVYRLFPGGLGELFVAVAESVIDDVCERLGHAAQGPFSDAKRMEDLLAALFTYFTANPADYRLVFQDAWATRDPEVARAVVAARSRLAAEIAGIVASGGGDADDVLLTSTGILGCALANLELVLADAADGEAAWRVTCALAVSCLR